MDSAKVASDKRNVGVPDNGTREGVALTANCHAAPGKIRPKGVHKGSEEVAIMVKVRIVK